MILQDTNYITFILLPMWCMKVHMCAIAVSSVIAYFDYVSRNGDNQACEDRYGPDNNAFDGYITYKLLNRDCRFWPLRARGILLLQNIKCEGLKSNI